MAAEGNASAVAIELVRALPAPRDDSIPEGPCAIAACELFWTASPESPEEGLDPRVIDCLSDAFCAFGKVTFVSDKGEDGGTVESPWQRLLHLFMPRKRADSSGASIRRLRLPRIRSRPLFLVETEHPKFARDLFLIQAWHFAPCQIVFLREPFRKPISLSDADIEATILDGGWSVLHNALRASSSRVVCTPGHDACCLKLVFADEKTLHLFSDVLQACCTGHRLPCTSVI